MFWIEEAGKKGIPTKIQPTGVVFFNLKGKLFLRLFKPKHTKKQSRTLLEVGGSYSDDQLVLIFSFYKLSVY